MQPRWPCKRRMSAVVGKAMAEDASRMGRRGGEEGTDMLGGSRAVGCVERRSAAWIASCAAQARGEIAKQTDERDISGSQGGEASGERPSFIFPSSHAARHLRPVRSRAHLLVAHGQGSAPVTNQRVVSGASSPWAGNVKATEEKVVVLKRSSHIAISGNEMSNAAVGSWGQQGLCSCARAGHAG